MMQDWFLQAKLGIFIHWGIYAVKPTGESWPFFLGEISHADYMAQAQGFTAAAYDPQAWAQLFRRAGADYAVLTTKHHDGFALWPTRLSPCNAVEGSPAGRDLVGPYCAALRAEGLRVGLYFSHLDWTHPDYASVPHDDPAFKPRENRFNFRGERDDAAWKRFVAFHRGQLQELSERYEPDLFWFDGGWERSDQQWRFDLLREQLHAWNPQGVVLNDRMHGHGDYTTPEQGLPHTPPEGPWEFCLTMNNWWGYMPTDTDYKSTEQLIWYFVSCITRGGRLLLDIGPDASGRIPDPEIERLEQLGDWIRRYDAAIHGTRAGMPLGHCQWPSTLSADARTLYLFAFGPAYGQIPLNGIVPGIRRARVVGTDAELEVKGSGGAHWGGMPPIRWVNFPEEHFQAPCTVIALELDAPLSLWNSSGSAIEFNQMTVSAKG